MHPFPTRISQELHGGVAVKTGRKEKFGLGIRPGDSLTDGSFSPGEVPPAIGVGGLDMKIKVEVQEGGQR